MCGIIGRTGTDTVLDDLLTGLQNLEYRGYDSAGVALLAHGQLDWQKCAGEITELERHLVAYPPSDGPVGIGHTRWSTHGPPTDDNAHPHTDCHGSVAVVHNGIIENHETLRRQLEAAGHHFRSETDTEVVPHLIEHHLEDGYSPVEAVRASIAELNGSYALAVVIEGVPEIFVARQGSPLVLGIADDGHFVASDVPAFLEFTDQVVYLDDGDFGRLSADGYELFTQNGTPVQRSVETVDWSPEDARKGDCAHYMLKEIYEQPMALDRALEGRVDAETGHVSLGAFPPGTFSDVEFVHLVGCGTSYHAALYAQHLLLRHGVPAQAFLASEYVPLSGDRAPLVVAITQSGETADTLGALRVARRAGSRTLSVTNVVGSTAARESDDALYIRAGPEIGVAATKTFVSQIGVLMLLATRLTEDLGATPIDRDALTSLARVPTIVESVVEDQTVVHVARRYQDAPAFFFIGRGLAYPVAMEGALKLKEISYEHAEGFPAGELKHGPLALVTPETPVVAIFTGDREEDAKTRSNVREVTARGAPVIAIVPDGSEEFATIADEVLTIPSTHPFVVGMPATAHLQLFAYHVAALLDRPIDKPRNLAKSVTVE